MVFEPSNDRDVGSIVLLTTQPLGMSQTVLLENLSKTKHLVEKLASCHRITEKVIHIWMSFYAPHPIIYKSRIGTYEIRMDEFSSKRFSP